MGTSDRWSTEARDDRRRRRRPFDGRTGLACGRCRRRRMNREPTKWERCESAAVKSYTRARHCDARKRHHPLALVHAMAKVQVRIKTCFCCSLTVATIFIAIYTVLLYSLFIGLAGWGLADTAENGDSLNSHYDSCLKEAEGKIRADNRKLQYKDGATTIIVEDSTSYHCSLGLYTAELKHPSEFRYGLLILNLLLFVLLIISAVLLVIALGLYIQWLLLPWVAFMTLDVIRGIISVLFIFIYSHGNLARIAVGIFFLGVQFFHISLIMIIVAKFQRMHDKINGVDYKMQPPPDRVIMADGGQVYPTMPSNYTYSNSPQMHRDGFYQPNSASYNTYVGNERRVRQKDADAARSYRPGPYDTMGSPYRQDPSNVGRTM